MAGGNFCVPEGGHCHLVSIPRATPVPHRRKRPHAGQEMRIQTYRVLVVRSANGIRLLSASVLREGGGLATTPFCDSLPFSRVPSFRYFCLMKPNGKSPFYRHPASRR